MNDNKIISEECVRHRRSLPISSLLYTSTALNEKHTQFIYKIFSFQFFREIKSIYERSQTEGSEGDVEKNAKHHTHTHHIHQNVWKLVVFADTVVALRLRRGKSWSAAWSMRCWYVSDVVMSEEVMMQKRKENEKVKTSAQEEQSGERRDRCHDPKEFKQIQIHKMSEPGRRLKIHFRNCTNNRRTLNVYEKWKKKNKQIYSQNQIQKWGKIYLSSVRTSNLCHSNEINLYSFCSVCTAHRVRSGECVRSAAVSSMMMWMWCTYTQPETHLAPVSIHYKMPGSIAGAQINETTTKMNRRCESV